MKRIIPLGVVVLLNLILPAATHADYDIYLKSGGHFTTPMYWEGYHEIKFYVRGGVMGVEKKSVRKIEKRSDDSDGYDYVSPDPKTPAPAKPAPEAAATGQQEAREDRAKVNIQDHRKKKDELTVELDGMMEKMREATSIKDDQAREKALEEVRKVSGQIYKLTDEVTESNKGKLPEGWWDKNPGSQ